MLNLEKKTDEQLIGHHCFTFMDNTVEEFVITEVYRRNMQVYALSGRKVNVPAPMNINLFLNSLYETFEECLRANLLANWGIKTFEDLNKQLERNSEALNRKRDKYLQQVQTKCENAFKIIQQIASTYKSPQDLIAERLPQGQLMKMNRGADIRQAQLANQLYSALYDRRYNADEVEIERLVKLLKTLEIAIPIYQKEHTDVQQSKS